MPTLATTVGPLPVPAVVGAVDAEFVDETTSRLLSYIAFWLNDQLSPKLATMTTPPPTDGAPIGELAVPPGHAYSNSPTSVILQRVFPSLFVYWNNAPAKYEQLTICRQVRVRTFDILYAFERVVDIEGVTRWGGLISSVDAVIARAFNKGFHPGYTFDVAYPPGTHIRWMNSWDKVEFLGGVEGFLAEQASAELRALSLAQGGRANAARTEGGIIAGNPCYRGQVKVWESVNEDQAMDPDDAAKDALMHMDAGEGSGEVVPDFLQRVLEAGDGTDEAEDP